MSIQSYPKGITEVQELILLRSTYVMSIPASTGSQTDSITHNLGRVPFFDYYFSFDNITFVPPYKGYNTNTSDTNLHSLSAYADSTKLYFLFQSQSTPLPLTLYIRYKIFVTEAT